jgi:predicted AlkP superfamily pyrophosphatase or phosphodiesterase
VPPKAMTAVLPPIFTILRRRSLTESSRTGPMREQPWVKPGSVVSRTRAIAIFSASWAPAGPASVAVIISSAPATYVVARLFMAVSRVLLYAVLAMIPDRLRQVRLTLRVLLVAVSALIGESAGAGSAAAQQPVQTPLLLMISIDGLRPDYVTAADAHGARIPNLRRFLQDGAFAQGVVGVIPTVTYPSHTTLITGVSPATHGIFANTTFDPLRENRQGWYWYSEDIRVATLWDAASRAGLSTASVQWPVSVGARVTWNIPEFWRAGTPDDAKLLRAVSTPGLLAELEPELGPYPRALTVESDEQRARYAARILEKKRPNLMTLHLIALDHVQHVTGPFTADTMAVLERIDTVVGTLRATAEAVAPGGAHVAIVSDHGFGKTTMELNLYAELRRAGLITVSAGKVTDWKAMPWTAGGAVAVVLKDPADAATLATVRALLDRLAADPAHGIDRVLDAAALRARGGFPTAAFVVGLKPDWHAGSSLTGSLVGKAAMAGMHGHLPDLPDLHAAFFVVGPGVPAGRALGVIDMRDIATTLARRLNLSLPAAEGRELWP